MNNIGDVDADNVRVEFYWADPTFGAVRSHAHLVGSASVNAHMNAGPQDVLCLVPWVPVFVNDGHECLVAVAIHPGNPLPTPLLDAFDAPLFSQVAQRNLTVLPAAPMLIALTIHGAARRGRHAVLTVEVGGQLDRETLTSLGLPKARLVEDRRVDVGLRAKSGCVAPDEPVGAEKLEVNLEPGRPGVAYLNVRPLDLAEDECQFVQVVEREGEIATGGIGFVIVHGKDR